MKITIRFSIDGEQDGALRNQLLEVVNAEGIVLKSSETATYECMTIAPVALSKALAAVWRVADTHLGPGKNDQVGTPDVAQRV